MLTEYEVMALSAILDKAIEEAEDGDPEFQEVSAKDVNPFGDPAALMVVYERLAKSGFVECSLFEDVTGKHEEYVCITPSGIQALKATSGVH
jgi:hypothetical protein